MTVNGVGIAETRIAEEMDQLRESYVSYVRANGGEPSEAQLREWAEENLIEDEVLRQEAAASQPEPPDERAKQYIEANPDYFDKFSEGDRLTVSKDELRLRALEKAIRKGVPKISDDEVRRDYDSHPEYYVTSEKLRLSHICRFIGAGGLARSEAFLELLRLKADLASQRCDWFDVLGSSDSFRQDYGMFAAVGRGDLPEDVEEKLFALEVGGVSDVLELDGSSLHLFRLITKEPAGKLGFQEIRERLRDMLFESAYQEAREKLLDALKAKAVIRREA